MLPIHILKLSDPDDKQMMLELYEDYDKFMFTISLGYTRNEKDAEDVVQNSWLSLCSAKSLETLRKISKEKPLETKKYLARCVRNKSVDLLRKRSKVRSNEVPLESEELIRVNSMDDGVDSHLILQAEVQDLMIGIQSLPQKQKEYLTMRYIENLSYKEIAQSLGKTEDSVRSQISNATKNLKFKVQEMRMDHADE